MTQQDESDEGVIELSAKAKLGRREAVALVTLEGESILELVIQLPECWPLEGAKLECRKGVGSPIYPDQFSRVVVQIQHRFTTSAVIHLHIRSHLPDNMMPFMLPSFDPYISAMSHLRSLSRAYYRLEGL